MPPVGSRVLLEEARGVLTEARPDAPRVVGDGIGLRIAEVVGHVGELVELRSVAAPAHEVCTASGADPAFELRFFVRPEELQPVLGKPKRIEFEDGTKLAFAPGVPIVGANEYARLRVHTNSFEVPIADEEIARWFQPAPVETPELRRPTIAGRPLHYGEREIDNTLSPWFDVAYAYQETERGTLLSFVSGCGDFTLRLDLDPPVRRDPPDAPGRVASPYGGSFAVDDGDGIWGGSGCESDWNLGLRSEKPGPGLGGGPAKSSSQVKTAKAEVSPGLDRDIVRRITHAHINEVRYCYDIGLASDPKLAGAVVIEFEITATGKVGRSKVERDDLESSEADVGACIAKAVRRWTFPKPMGGRSVTVVYPFQLSSG